MSKDMAEYFDDYSKYYDKKFSSRFFKKNHVWLLENLDDLNKKKILDIGCGTGELVYTIKKLFNQAEIYGVDISPKMIEKAKRLNDFGKFTVGSVDKLDYEDNYFDVIVNTASFHHYENPYLAISEMKRVLKPGGKIYILDSVRDFGLLSFLPYYWDFVEKSKCYTRHLYTREFRNIFAENGFNNIKTKRFYRFNFVIYLLIQAQK